MKMSIENNSRPDKEYEQIEDSRDFSISSQQTNNRDFNTSNRGTWNQRDFSTSQQQWKNDFSHSNRTWNQGDYTVSNQQSYDTNEYTPLISTTQSTSLIAYKRRWLTLFIFSMNTMMNGLLFMSLSPINNIVVRYYNVPSVNVEWLSNMFMLSYIFLALPSSYLMSKWGVRPIITIASCLDFIATVLHFIGSHRDRFWLVLVGQGFAAVAYCMIIQIPGKLSSQWFPERESATATSIGVFMNLLGVAVGFLQPALMVKDSHNMNVVQEGLSFFFISQMFLSGAILLLTTAYKEKPRTPPTLSSLRESTCFVSTIKSLLRNKYYIILAQSYGIYFGLFVTFSVLVNPLLTMKFPSGYESSLGWMGFWCDMAAILSCLLIGLLLDKFSAHQLTAVLLNFFSMCVWLAFILCLVNMNHFTTLYILYVVLGIVGIPYFASGMEQAAEMTYPVSEETSSTIILILGNLYGFIFIYTLGVAAEYGYVKVVGFTMVGLYCLSTLFALFAKTELNRTNAEKQAYRKMIAKTSSTIRKK